MEKEKKMGGDNGKVPSFFPLFNLYERRKNERDLKMSHSNVPFLSIKTSKLVWIIALFLNTRAYLNYLPCNIK